MNSTTFRRGGYDPTAPAQNKASEANPETGTWTEWDEDGNITVQRKLTADELAALTPPPAPAQPLMVDPAAVAALVTQTQAATTLTEVKNALLATFAAIAGQAPPT